MGRKRWNNGGAEGRDEIKKKEGMEKERRLEMEEVWRSCRKRRRELGGSRMDGGWWEEKELKEERK